MSAIFELEINIGSGIQETFVWRDAKGNPIDMTGRGAEFSIFPDVGEPVLFQMDTDSATTDTIVLGGIFGMIEIDVQPASVVNMPLENTLRFAIDVWDDSADSTINRRRIIKGNCVVIGTHG